MELNRIVTPIDKYRFKSRDLETAYISKDFGGYRLEWRELDLVLPSLKIIFRIMRDIYRKVNLDGKDLEIVDRETTLKIGFGEFYKVLNLEEREHLLENERKRLSRIRRTYGSLPTQPVSKREIMMVNGTGYKVNPKALRPLEKTW